MGSRWLPRLVRPAVPERGGTSPPPTPLVRGLFRRQTPNPSRTSLVPPESLSVAFRTRSSPVASLAPSRRTSGTPEHVSAKKAAVRIVVARLCSAARHGRQVGGDALVTFASFDRRTQYARGR
jgi:hypothetical protein